MKISDFNLESLGLKGNYSVMINYIEAKEGHSEFIEFLASHKLSKYVLSENQNFIKSEIEMNLKAIPTAKIETTTNISIQTVKANVAEIPFSIFRSSKDFSPARKNYFIFTIKSF